MPHFFHPHRGFTVFQMSSVGDLFYQSFFFFTRDDENVQLENKQKQQLHSKAKALCQKWINVVDQGILWILKKQGNVKDILRKEKIKEKFAWIFCSYQNLIPVIPGILCNDRQIEEVDEGSEDSGICERCELEIGFSRKLVEHEKSSKIVTKSI